MIPLEDLADIKLEDGVYEIWRKDRQRRAMITVNVRGPRPGRLRRRGPEAASATRSPCPRGYYLEWGGTFENLQSATKRLTIVVPVALALIFLLLFATFGSVRLGILIFLSVPLGAIGGVLALWLRGHELQHLGGRRLHRPLGRGGARRPGARLGDPPARSRPARRSREAVHEASMARLRPILMTGLVASLGLRADGLLRTAPGPRSSARWPRSSSAA